MGRRARRRGAQLGFPRARCRLPRDRPVPLPPEARAPAPRAGGREPGRARLGTALARAALPGRAGAGERRPLAAAHANRFRSQPDGAAPGDPVPEERLAESRHDRDPRRDRGRRRAAARATRGGEADRRPADQEESSALVRAVADAARDAPAAAGADPAPTPPLERSLLEPGDDHQETGSGRRGQEEHGLWIHRLHRCRRRACGCA